jgi:2'-5' RNA ligase
MKHIKLFEEFLNEKSGDSYSSGCVMLYFDFPEMNKIHDAIDPQDLYEEEGDRTFGLEDEPHITLLYGLKDSVTVDQVTEIVDGFTFGPCILHNASLFKNEYDVLKFDVRYPTKGGAFLHKCNKALTTLPYQSNYPHYHPHMTIAYLKKGTGKKYCKRMTGHEFELIPTHAVFSQPDGTKTKIKINI